MDLTICGGGPRADCCLFATVLAAFVACKIVPARLFLRRARADAGSVDRTETRGAAGAGGLHLTPEAERSRVWGALRRFSSGGCDAKPSQ